MSRGMRVFVYVLVFLGVLVIAGIEMSLISTGRQVPDHLLITLLIFWALLVGALYSYLSIRKKRSVLDKLYNCHAREFIDSYIPLVERIMQPAVKQSMLLTLSTGYFAIGQDTYAKLLLDQVKQLNGAPLKMALPIMQRISTSLIKIEPKVEKPCQVSDKWVSPGLQFVYASNLFFYYLHINDLEKVSTELYKMKGILDSAQWNDKNRKLVQYIYNDKSFCLQMANGNYGSAENFFKDHFENTEKLFDKVSCQYTLGLIYQHTGKPEEAKAAFAYAIENGGDTRYVTEAKYHLEQMEKEATC